MSFNKITIVGYLGRDPELRYTAQGTAVCKMSIATTEKRKNVAGLTEEHTTWFRVTAWGRQAELSNEYLTKGRQVYIEGRLRLEEYTDREGNLRVSPEVNATDVQFIGQRTDSGEKPAIAADRNPQIKAEDSAGQSEAPPVKAPGKAKNRAPQKELVSIEEDDIPF